MSPSVSHRLRLAAHLMHRGGVMAYPTEAVYGLGCDPWNGEAVARLLAIKRRDVSKGLILIAADAAQLAPFVEELPAARMAEIRASWPGPHTWLLPAHAATPGWLTGRFETLAVRVTAHPLAARLCRVYGGAIVSTSANRSGHPPARSRLAVQRTLGPLPCLPGRLGGLAGPTAIFDLATGRGLRPGPSKDAS